MLPPNEDGERGQTERGEHRILVGREGSEDTVEACLFLVVLLQHRCNHVVICVERRESLHGYLPYFLGVTEICMVQMASLDISGSIDHTAEAQGRHLSGQTIVFGVVNVHVSSNIC